MFLSIGLRHAKRLAPIVTFLVDGIKIFVAVMAAAWLISIIGQTPAWLMLAIPGYLMVQNGLMRIRRVKAGKSKVKRMLEQNAEPEFYDQRHDLFTERAHLYGDVTGWIAGASLFVKSGTFF